VLMTGLGVDAVSVQTGPTTGTHVNETLPPAELVIWKSAQFALVNVSVAAEDTAGITSASARPNAAMMNRGRMVTP
jgi:hypothetical protein